jgi:hypothetical protein
MASTWTPEQVTLLAPDTSSLKAAQSLATARKWVLLQQGDEVIWGECQGSGKKPYQTAVILTDPAYRCSCPSRKFPCKHALALLLLFSRQPQLLATAESPEWVQSWLDSRAARAVKAAAKSSQTPVDPAAQAKRAEKREQNVEEGVAACELWLQDLIRRGLASVQSQSYRYWDGLAARLVDAQAPGLARLVRQLSTIPASGDGWPERLLHQLARLHLLIQGYQHLDSLPPERQADVRTAVGWQMKQEEVLDQPGTIDQWLVLARRIEEEDGLRSQRTWLWGQETSQPALILDFAYRGQALVVSWLPGTQFKGELAFYPGSVPLRALCKSRLGDVEPLANIPPHETMAVAVAHFNSLIAHNPWLERAAFPIAHITPTADSSGWWLHDVAQNRLPLAPTFSQRWQLLALSGGHPLTVVAEWDGIYWLPLSAWADGRFVNFT